MATKREQWPIWWIGVAAVGLAAVAVALLLLSSVTGSAVRTTDEARPPAVLTFPNFLMMVGVAVAMLSALALLWLILRVREARLPVWERNERRRKRRRH